MLRTLRKGESIYVPVGTAIKVIDMRGKEVTLSIDLPDGGEDGQRARRKLEAREPMDD